MANDRILLNAKAKQLGIANYRQLSLEDLTKAVKGANGNGSAKGKTAASKAVATAVKGKASTPAKSTPAKGKATPAAKPTPAKGKATVSKPAVKGKTAATAPKKAAPAKSTPRKTTPAKATAAKGTAKRPTTKAVGKTAAPVRKTASAKASASTANVRPKATIAKAGEGSRNMLDLKAIDWTNTETRIGRSGKRQLVLQGLRKHKSYVKVFDMLAPMARQAKPVRFYPGKSKADAEKLLRWLIARVAYDYALVTGQHEPGSRQAYGTSQGRVAKAKPAAPKATGARKTAAKPATKGKAAPAARKPAAKRTTAAKATTPGRKPAARATGKPVAKGRATGKR